MVVERVHQTKLPSHIVFNGIRNYLSQYQIQVSEINNWTYFMEIGDTTVFINVRFEEFELFNKVTIRVDFTAKGLFGSKPLSGNSEELANSLVGYLNYFEHEMEILKTKEEEMNKINKLTASQTILRNSVNIVMPEHVESDTQSSVYVEIKNTSKEPILNFLISFPDSEDYFTISGEMRLSKILPGIELEQMFTIKPKFHKGTFPLCVKMSGNDVSVFLNYSVKVGGTEIY